MVFVFFLFFNTVAASQKLPWQICYLVHKMLKCIMVTPPDWSESSPSAPSNFYLCNKNVQRVNFLWCYVRAPLPLETYVPFLVCSKQVHEAGVREQRSLESMLSTSQSEGGGSRPSGSQQDRRLQEVWVHAVEKPVGGDLPITGYSIWLSVSLLCCDARQECSGAATAVTRGAAHLQLVCKVCVHRSSKERIEESKQESHGRKVPQLDKSVGNKSVYSHMPFKGLPLNYIPFTTV